MFLPTEEKNSINAEFRSRPRCSCDAPSQNGVGDALVASGHDVFPPVSQNATWASRAPFGDEASPLHAPCNFGIRFNNSDVQPC